MRKVAAYAKKQAAVKAPTATTDKAHAFPSNPRAITKQKAATSTIINRTQRIENRGISIDRPYLLSFERPGFLFGIRSMGPIVAVATEKYKTLRLSARNRQAIRRQSTVGRLR
jgi:hypothetical protein